MTRYGVMESALEERYEYLEELVALRDKVDKLITSTESDIDRLIVKILQSPQ